jgi:aminoglycoside phosphotransferase (APT) family kinase protein
LPLPIPVPLAQGVPDDHYPWPWSVYRWQEGETAAVGHIADLQACAVSLAEFLHALHKIDSTGGPPPGKHNFFRGGSLMVYDDETRTSIMALRGLLDTDLAAEIWAAAINSTWQGQPVWVHGDYAAGNLLVKQGRLSAVIDFGSSSVGDPACDLTIAWTFLSGAGREAFRAALPLDRGTWARARGWALWKALITLVEYLHTDVQKANAARHVISEVFEDYKRNK